MSTAHLTSFSGKKKRSFHNFTPYFNNVSFLFPAFSNGLLDPWSSGGILRSVSKTVVSLIIPEGAHHLDLRGSNPHDPPSVIKTRFAANFYSSCPSHHLQPKKDFVSFTPVGKFVNLISVICLKFREIEKAWIRKWIDAADKRRLTRAGGGYGPDAENIIVGKYFYWKESETAGLKKQEEEIDLLHVTIQYSTFVIIFCHHHSCVWTKHMIFNANRSLENRCSMGICYQLKTISFINVNGKEMSDSSFCPFKKKLECVRIEKVSGLVSFRINQVWKVSETGRIKKCRHFSDLKVSERKHINR